MKTDKLTKILVLILSITLIAVSVLACTGKKESSESEPETEHKESSTEETGMEIESDPDDESESESNGPRLVTDHAGHEVEIPENIERIVVCDIYPLPSILTVFFDSAEKIVGMGAPSMSAAKNSLLGKMYPEILNANTSFINGTTVNIEELMALNPDIVFYNAGNKALGEELTGAGLTGFAMSAGKWGYDALETLNQWILTFDQIFPGNEKYEVVKK